MLAIGIAFGILLLLLLMAGMWLAFNMNDYGVNDWVDDEDDNVAERRNGANRLEARMEEVDHQTMELERRRGKEVVEARMKVGREEVYCISKHSPSVSLDSAISVGSPLDSTGKTSIVSHNPSLNQFHHKNPPWETSPSAFTLVFSSAESFRPSSSYPTPTSPQPPRSDHLTISLPPKSDIQAIRVVREVEENTPPTSVPPRSPSPKTQTPDLVHKSPSAQSKSPSPCPDPGMFSPPSPEPSPPNASHSPSALPPASFASPSTSPSTSPSPSPPVLDVPSTSSPPSTPASPHSAQISVLLESLPRRGDQQTPVAAWPETLPRPEKEEEEHIGSFEESFDQITLADRKPVRPVSTSYKLESLKLAAARAAVAQSTKG